MEDRATTFTRTARADFQIGMKYPFLLAILGVTLGFIFDNWQDLRISINHSVIDADSSPLCVMYYVFNSLSFGGVFTGYFSATMAAIPFSSNYCWELDDGISIYKISRCGQRTYVRSKFLVAAVLGGLTLFFGGLVFILLLRSYLPIVTTEKVLESQWIPFFHALTVGDGVPYLAIVLYLSFLSGALWGSVGLCASAYFPSNYVAVCFPFIFRFLLVQIGRLLKLPDGMRLDRLLVARGTIYSDSVTIVVTTMAVLAFILLCYRLFMRRMERRIWDEE